MRKTHAHTHMYVYVDVYVFGGKFNKRSATNQMREGIQFQK